MHSTVIRIHKIKLVVTKNWFREHPSLAKYPYMMPVNVIAPANMKSVPPRVIA